MRDFYKNGLYEESTLSGNELFLKGFPIRCLSPELPTLAQSLQSTPAIFNQCAVNDPLVSHEKMKIVKVVVVNWKNKTEKVVRK